MRNEKAIELLFEGRLKNPQDFLGIRDQKIYFLEPEKERFFFTMNGEKKEAKKIHPKGLFSFSSEKRILPFEYQLQKESGRFCDPYAFNQIISKEEIKRFNEGVHYDLYNLLGAHKKVVEGVKGIYFALWAPNATGVFLKGDFTRSALPMRFVEGGIFELFIPFAKEKDRYYFEVVGKDGVKRSKTDPFGHFFEKRPENKSIVFDVNKYSFQDQDWIKKRKKDSGPLNIYEVHLGSWLKGNPFFTYQELAHKLVSYVKKMDYTHVELLPVTEHPLDESWGYQVTGFFAPSSRFGTPSDFQYFVDYFHANGIGVFMDWVCGHFPIDEFSLSSFDGTSLYEHTDPLKGYHPVWNTAIFDFSKPQVTNFLISSALFFLDKMHIDGLRVDAVSSMLFLDHERKEGQWKKNREGTNLNLEARSFLRHLNEIVHLKHPQCMMIAEESTAYRGVTHSIYENGLGFDLKWNMGWMNDTLKYFSTPNEHLSKVHKFIDFTLVYLFDEKFVLPFSHDEVVHLKKSLFGKMGSFNKLKLLLLYQYCYPGKKLLFMGQELAQKTEWDCQGQIDWELLKDQNHLDFQSFVQRLNAFYRQEKALWENDHQKGGFECLFSYKEQAAFGFLRKGGNKTLVCLFNFSEKKWKMEPLPLEKPYSVNLLFSCDEYGKEDKICLDDSYYLNPLSAQIFEVEFEKKDTVTKRLH